jgi:hypothetical protein
MTTWNYRVFREESGDYVIREVFYDADGSIISCTEDAVEPMGQSLEELTQDIEWFREALALPVLTLADVPSAAANGQKELSDKRDHLSREEVMAEIGLE